MIIESNYNLYDRLMSKMNVNKSVSQIFANLKDHVIQLIGNRYNTHSVCNHLILDSIVTNMFKENTDIYRELKITRKYIK